MSRTEKRYPNAFLHVLNVGNTSGTVFKMKSGIYAIKNKENNKLYIGQTINLEKREAEHFRELLGGYHFNSYLQKSFNKYGKDAFEFLILEECKVDELNELEVYHIKKAKSMKREHGYNLRAGGDRPFLSEESKRKISETTKARIKLGLIKINPVNFTDEVKERLSISSKKRFSDEEERIKLSIAKSTIDIETVKRIKEMLYNDIEVDDISKELSVESFKIKHIANLNSFTYVSQEYNYYIKNRLNILQLREAKVVMAMYRNGETYQAIANKISKHIRTAIRIVNKNKTEADETMRDNVLKYKKNKQYSMIKTMKRFGKTHRFIAKRLNVSTATVIEVLSND